jgi:hypothetical protein
VEEECKWKQKPITGSQGYNATMSGWAFWDSMGKMK